MKADFTVYRGSAQEAEKATEPFLVDGRAVWEQFRAGDRRAFETIYLQNFDSLYDYGMFLVRDREMVKDVIHDLFELLWVKRESLGVVKSVASYLFISFRRKLLQSQKKQGKHLKLVQEMDKEGVRAEAEQMEDIKHTDRLHDQLQHAVKKLTPKQQEILMLKFHSRLTHQQVAELMGIKKGDVYYHFSKAIEELSQVLSRYI
ncbi:RNA polymerase sigma factor [Sinomicrobium sp.]